MDALGLDVMHEEYQKMQQDAAQAIKTHDSPPEPRPPPSSPPEAPSSSLGGDLEGVGERDTVPVSDEVDLAQASPIAPIAAVEGQSSVSSSSSSEEQHTSTGSSSLYNASSLSPTINYDKEFPTQKLVAVIGRQFDQPNEVASSLQKLSELPTMKFVPFTMKRRALLKGTFNSADLMKHDLICMCYNASEARILLTGVDGFYTSLLRRTEAVLGPNKVAFLISNYTQSESDDQILISPALRRRLDNQAPLRKYLEADQILSWKSRPNGRQVEKLMELANLENNPENQACNIL